MDRYEIAKAAFKSPEELFKQPKKSNIKSFGFDDPPGFAGNFKAKTYYCPAGTVRRVGIVFQNPGHLFVGGKVHWINRRYVLCKKGSCCKFSGATMRVACVLNVYNSLEFNVIPWVFTRVTYTKLNELNDSTPLQSNDFMLERGREQFELWKVSSINPGLVNTASIWQNNEGIKEEVLRLAEPHFLNLKSCLGLDLSESEIKNLIKDSPDQAVNDYRPPPRPQQRAPVPGVVRIPIGTPIQQDDPDAMWAAMRTQIFQDENP
jgi:hypothetical protein